MVFQTHRVHPHGCGEHHGIPRHIRLATGSSPRVWGTHLWRGWFAVFGRFIPTGVGNTDWPGFHDITPPVHPHGCGEHSICYLLFLHSIIKEHISTGICPHTLPTIILAFFAVGIYQPHLTPAHFLVPPARKKLILNHPSHEVFDGSCR